MFVNIILFVDRSLKAVDMLLLEVKLILDKSLNEIQFWFAANWRFEHNPSLGVDKIKGWSMKESAFSHVENY